MDKNLIFTDKEIEFLRELIHQKVEFIIVGLAAAALQGAPVVTQDIDLWFKDLNDHRILNALKKVGGTYVPPTLNNPPMFAGEAVSLFDIVIYMHGLDSFDKEKKHILKIPLKRFKIPVLSLERIIKSKKTTNRKKDQLIVPVLKDALVAIKELKK